MIKMINKNDLKSLALSVVIHATFLTLLIMHFSDNKKYLIPGKAAILQVKLISDNSADHKTIPIKKQGKIAVSKHSQVAHEKSKKIQKNHTSSAPKINGDNLNQLISLIYSQIAEHKIYPEQARQLGQSGEAVIAFTILPDGQIKNITIQKSSGYSSLDDAAKSAIRTATPFAGVNRYITKAQAFAIKINFD